MHIMDNKNNKKGYIPPVVKTVSFMVEQGFQGSGAKVGDRSTVDELTPTFGTQRYGDQTWSSDNISWRQSAQQ